jgi:F-type H+-transporting ATPase subunit b
VLYFFALKPLKKLMDERGATIAGGLENAKKQEELLAQANADYEAKMAKANLEVIAKIKEGAKAAQEKGDQIIEKSHQEALAIIAAGQKQAEANAAKMMEEIKKEAVSLIIATSEKVLGNAVSEKVDAKLVEESMKNM